MTSASASRGEGGGSGRGGRGKRPRTAFNCEQIQRLQSEFCASRYPTETRREELAKEVGLAENQVKNWFQTERAKTKKSCGGESGKKPPTGNDDIKDASVAQDGDSNNNNNANKSMGKAPVMTPWERQRVKKYGESLLHIAARKGDVSRVRSLIQSCMDVNAKDNAGWSVLHESIGNLPQMVDIVQMLVESGANINIQADDGRTPLHDAAAREYEAIIKCLLGSSVDHRSN